MIHPICSALVCTALISLPLMSHASAPLSDPDAPGQQGWYVGIGGGNIDYREPGLAWTAINTEYLYLQGGWQFNRYLSVDARLGTHVSSGFDWQYVDGVPVSVRVQSAYGLYVRATAPIASRWALFALGGFAGLKVKADAGIASVNDTANSVSWGVGASWKPDPAVSIDLEYLPTLARGNGWTTQGFNVGARVRF